MKRILFPIVGAAVLLAGCNKSSKEPTGQVVATVDGKEITTSDLQFEIGQLSPDPNIAKQQQSQALQSVIARKVMADEAEKRGLDKTPVAAMAEQKAREIALASMLEQSIVSKAAKVSPSEAQAFVADHPATFANRMLLTVDQLIALNPTPALVKALEPVNTMPEVIKLLDSRGVQYCTSGAVLDTLMVNPDVAGKLEAMNVGAVFMTPVGTALQISGIRDKRAAPLTGDAATQAATAMLTQQRRQGAAQQEIMKVIENAKKSVKINPQFQSKDAGAATPGRAPSATGQTPS